MARSSAAPDIPKYRRHSSGQARVVIAGRSHYLDAMTLELEQLSDQLLAAGAEQVIFDYGVRLEQSATEGRYRAWFHIVKLSLRGRRLVELASLAIVQNVGTFHPPAGSDLQQS